MCENETLTDVAWEMVEEIGSCRQVDQDCGSGSKIWMRKLGDHASKEDLPTDSCILNEDLIIDQYSGNIADQVHILYPYHV